MKSQTTTLPFVARLSALPELLSASSFEKAIPSRLLKYHTVKILAVRPVGRARMPGLAVVQGPARIHEIVT